MTSLARIKIAAAVLLAFAAAAPAAAAQECSTSDSMIALTACYNKLLAQADKDMQAKYQEIEAPVKHLSIQDQQLAKSQETWVAYRDQTCQNAVRLHWLEGTYENVSIVTCKLVLTRERTADLEAMFQPLFGVMK